MPGLLEKLIHPPLLNSANPWATTEADLEALYDSLSTGAVTTRTSLLQGFAHDDAVHQYAFFDSAEPASSTDLAPGELSSLNTLGYSPVPLRGYLEIVRRLTDPRRPRALVIKPFIVSVTGTPAEVVECFWLVSDCARECRRPMLMEVNLSCPNIPGKPPPAYDEVALGEYLNALSAADGVLMRAVDDVETALIQHGQRVLVGMKTPPYTHLGQFSTLISALLSSVHPGTRRCPISFVTAVNTLGSSLVLDPSPAYDVGNEDKSSSTPRSWTPALASANGSGIGGLAGAALHPLALGNVATLRRMLDEATSDSHDRPLASIEIIGVGGVSSRTGFERMRAVGAAVVGVGTALGAHGVGVFEDILQGNS